MGTSGQDLVSTTSQQVIGTSGQENGSSSTTGDDESEQQESEGVSLLWGVMISTFCLLCSAY